MNSLVQEESTQNPESSFILEGGLLFLGEKKSNLNALCDTITSHFPSIQVFFSHPRELRLSLTQYKIDVLLVDLSETPFEESEWLMAKEIAPLLKLIFFTPSLIQGGMACPSYTLRNIHYIETPASTDVFHTALEKALNPHQTPAHMSGELESGGLADLIQLVNSKGKTCTVELEQGFQHGKLRFVHGQLVEAQCQLRQPPDKDEKTVRFHDLTGVESFHQMLEWVQGNFWIDLTESSEEREVNIHQNWEFLLLEHARLMDEQGENARLKSTTSSQTNMEWAENEEIKAMSRLQLLQEKFPELTLIVELDSYGTVEDFVGKGDAEELAASCFYSLQGLEEAAGLLGMGEVLEAGFEGNDETWMLFREKESIVTSFGKEQKMQLARYMDKLKKTLHQK